jgi:hypothetical protein
LHSGLESESVRTPERGGATRHKENYAMKTVIRRYSLLLKMLGMLTLTAAAVLALQVPGEARLSSSERITTSPVYWGDAVVGTSTLVRTPKGISFTYHTSGLVPGQVVTLWIVVFNHPEACNQHPCVDEENIFFNPPVQGDFLLGAGHVIGGSGIGNFGGHLRVGDTSQSGRAEVDGISFGLLDPMNAEIHMALHSHGPAVPGRTLKAQLSSFLGGCVGGPENFVVEPDFPDEVGECITFQSSIHQ